MSTVIANHHIAPESWTWVKRISVNDRFLGRLRSGEFDLMAKLNILFELNLLGESIGMQAAKIAGAERDVRQQLNLIMEYRGGEAQSAILRAVAELVMERRLAGKDDRVFGDWSHGQLVVIEAFATLMAAVIENQSMLPYTDAGIYDIEAVEGFIADGVDVQLALGVMGR